MHLSHRSWLAAACCGCLAYAAGAGSPLRNAFVAPPKGMRPSTPALGANLQPLDDSNMIELLFRPPDGRAVLVDAQPCKLIEPYLENCAKKHSDKLSVVKYDVEGGNNDNLKVELLLQGVMISGLPTLVLYNNGAPLATHSGVITEEGLEKWIDDNLFSRMVEIGAGKMHSEAESTKDPDGDDSATASKRGFVSFASQTDDDYMLSSSN
ncbi:hypothetical protein ACHAXT_012138 [Thalassiosira profunda]